MLVFRPKRATDIPVFTALPAEGIIYLRVALTRVNTKNGERKWADLNSE